jgi:hypothetical protein
MKEHKTMTNTIKISINHATYVFDKVDELNASREAWEQGSFKQSSEELYALLDNCLMFFDEVRGNKSKCSAVNNYLRSKSIDFNTGSSLQTRIVRAVFHTVSQKRSYAYAGVIKIASEEKRSTETMSDFITKRGGIEELRRTKQSGKSPKIERQERILLAQDKLSSAPKLAKSFEVTGSTRKFDEGAEHSLFVAVMREEADGTCSMVYETSASAVVNLALHEAGKSQVLKTTEEKQKKQTANSEAAANRAVEKAVFSEAA